MNRPVRHLWTTATLTWLGACAPSATGIVVEVDTDLEVPGQVDRVAFRLERGGVAVDHVQEIGSGARQRSLPLRVAFDLAESSGGPVDLSVVARLGSRDVLIQRARTTIPQGEIRLWMAGLDRQCLGWSCDAGTTCVPGRGCLRPELVPILAADHARPPTASRWTRRGQTPAGLMAGHSPLITTSNVRAAYDPINRRFLVVSNSWATWYWTPARDEWVELANPPPLDPNAAGLLEGGLVFEPRTRRFVLMASTSVVRPAGIFTWDDGARTWKLIREEPIWPRLAVYDAGRGLILTNGCSAWDDVRGEVRRIGRCLSAQQADPAPPIPWTMLYDQANQRMIGFDPYAMPVKIFALVGDGEDAVWRPLDPSRTEGPPVWGGAVTFDARRGRFVMFGGSVGGGSIRGMVQKLELWNELWEWDGATNLWEHRSPRRGVRPRGRSAPLMVYDPDLERVFIAGDSPENDVWEWNGAGEGR